MEPKERPISTSRPEDGYGGAEERETPGIVRHRYHAGHPSGAENGVPDSGGPVLLHQRDLKKKER